MKKVLLLILILVFSENVFAYTYEYSDEILNRLSFAEKIIFGRVNKSSDIEYRLGVAEKKLFGAVQSGDLYSRINLISTVLESNNVYQNNENNENSPLKIIKRALIQRQGLLTGFTPSVYPVYTQNYTNDFNRQITKIPQTRRRHRIHGNNHFNNSRLIRTY